MESCILEKYVPAASEKLLDWRFCFVEKGIGRVSCGLVGSLFASHIRSLQSVGTALHPTWEEQLTATPKQPSALGFQVENMVLSSIAAMGCKPAGAAFDQAPAKVVNFQASIPSFDQTMGFTLYIPMAANHRAVDAILVNRKTVENRMVAEVVGVQITLSDRHKDTEDAYFATAKQWHTELGCKEADVTHTFVWALEKLPPRRKIREEVEEKRRPQQLVHPAYTRIRCTIAAINQTVGEKLAAARA